MTAIPNLDFGPDAVILRTSVGPAWVVRSVASVPLELRQRAFAARGLDFRYYEIVEESLADQFDHRYLLMQHEATGEWAVQPLFFVQQDLLGGLPQALRTFFGSPRRVWPNFLKMRMLMIGCAAGEGDLDHDRPWLAQALHDALEEYRRKASAFIILLKDFPASYRESLQVFSKNGYQRAPSMPAARLSLDFATFDEYMMERLSKVFRKNLRRKLRASEEGDPIAMEVRTDSAGLEAELHGLYLQTYDRSDFQFERLNPAYFRLLGERMPERVRYFLWREKGRLVAFGLCLVHEGVLHDLGMGLDYAVALEKSLYFRTWRDMIEWGLQNGIKTYHTGPLNYDPKSHLKLHLSPLDLYARANWSLINPIFRLAIKYLEPTRHDPVLQRFPNAHELLGN